ncbi:lycopene cyclase domain-containing protein [Nocardioides sp. ChNu-153]|uniref:lycopene cyclase domain-containing protein n=1 Tax=unclassified Nocardioides TaxID=2615069 RepID=UPI00240743EF|nr:MULTISPECIES: lycopene cyclase domain-containing protein [unclassified Nocardioides]MDF9715733.1 lycopene cyclase domain-containing protein [Nocardioides sp. ChNu-99]MDN7121838.1 lycopene cyclase domain-containing protein [Nocardioides sp. ChNu-153]
MGQLTYAAMLVFVLVVTLPLELVLRTRVYARVVRLALTLLCVAVPFALWDVAAVHAGHWEFDLAQTLGVEIGPLPLEEWAFFLVVPLASVLTIEAVRSMRPGWRIGDEREERA